MLAKVSFKNIISLLTSWARFNFPEDGLLSISHESIQAVLVVSRISCDPEAVQSKVYHCILLKMKHCDILLQRLACAAYFEGNCFHSIQTRPAALQLLRLSSIPQTLLQESKLNSCEKLLCAKQKQRATDSI